MPPFNSLFKSLFTSSEFAPEHELKLRTWISRQPQPSISYQEVRDVVVPPTNEAVQFGVIYRVHRNNVPKWALFRCPCNCGAVITLSLQQAHRPRWSLRSTNDDRPSLRPSIWRDTGCLSHFWIEDGRAYFCLDTGYPPPRY